MENRSENPSEFPYAKTSSLLFLRNQDKAYRTKITKQTRMIRHRKYLKQNIYANNNIFQLHASKFSRKAAQNIIWQKNYKLKMAINIFRQENSSLKAKMWNIEKQNRKMDKQIQSWNLDKVFTTKNKKPYIDMATVSKVFADQDYEIVSIKIDIAKFQRILEEKEEEIQRLLKKSKETEKHLGFLKHMSSQAKLSLLTALKLENFQSNNQQFQTNLLAIKNKSTKEVVSCNEHIDFLKKNIELKSKINQSHLQQQQSIQKQCHNFKNISQQQIQKMKQQIRLIKIQQQNSIKDVKKSIKQLKKNNQVYQCQIQQQMGAFIKEKIQLNKQIDEVMDKIEYQLSDLECYRTEILGQIRKLD